MKNFLKSKHKFSHSLSHNSTNEKFDGHNSNNYLNTDRTDKNHLFSQNNTIQNEAFEDTIDVLNSNRTHRPLMQFPSSKISNYQARKLLVESNDVIKNNQSYFDFSLDDVNLHRKPNLNETMTIPNNPKITVQVPNSRDSWLSKSKAMRYQKRSLEVRDQFRDSIMSMRSDATDRLVDYKNQKNLRKSNLSTHEQFNLNILVKADNWGEQLGFTDSEQKPKTSKYSGNFSKHSALGNFLVTKRRVLNQKRREFWNASANEKHSLPRVGK